MEGSNHVRHNIPRQQTVSERVREFFHNASWSNFKAIFVGRTVMTTISGKHIPNPEVENRNYNIPEAVLKKRQIHMAKGIDLYTPKLGPENEREEVRKSGGVYGEEQQINAFELVKCGDFSQLEAMMRQFTEENEDEFIAVRDYLLDTGVLYDWTDDRGQLHKGAEEIVREVSVKFDGPYTRRIKTTPPGKDQTLAPPLSQQLQEQFSDPEDFKILRDTLYEDGYFTQQEIMAAIQDHSRSFDTPDEQRAKDLVMNYEEDPLAFQLHVKTFFATSESVKNLRDNLYENGFLMQETLHGFKYDSELKGEGSVLHYLNEQYNDLLKEEQRRARVEVLQSNDKDTITQWLASSAPAREDAASLIATAKREQNISTIAMQQLEAYYQQLLDQEIIKPMLAAGRKFANSEACAQAKEEYGKLDRGTQHNQRRKMQKDLASQFPELQQMMISLSREDIPSVEPDKLTTRASLEELSRLQDAIEQSDLPEIAKDVTCRALFLVRDAVEDELYEKMSYLLSHGMTGSLKDEFMLLEHRDDFDSLAKKLKDDLNQDRKDNNISRHDYLIRSRQLKNVLDKTTARLFPDERHLQRQDASPP